MDIKQFLAPVVNFISQDSLLKWTGRKTIFPYYHTISNVDLSYISNLYPLKTVEQFKREIDYLCKHFIPINIDEVIKRIESKDGDEKPGFHLTFDDGLKEIYTVIAPILEARGISATFFLNTDFIDNQGLFYRYKIGLIIERLKAIESKTLQHKVKLLLSEKAKWRDNMKFSLLNLDYNDIVLIEEIASILELDFKYWLLKNEPYLTSIQIKNLIDRGFNIGSHSIDHPRFKNIDIVQQKQQLEDSFSVLENNYKIKDRYFSFPFGDEDVSVEFFDWMNKEAKSKLSFGVSGIKDDYYCNHLHRIPMDNCIHEAKGFIKSEYLYFILKGIFNKNQIKRN